MRKLNSWSFSSLMNYERCPHSVEPGSKDYSQPRPEAAHRGIDIHKEIEEYLSNFRLNDVPEPKFGLPFKALAIQSPKCEEKWVLNDKWYPKEPAWLRCQIDAYVKDEGTIIIYDWKTGKRDGNEVKHTQQMQLYLCVATIIFPTIQNFTSQLWYIDQGKIVSGKTYTKDQLNPIAQRWDKRGKRMTSDTEFIAKPSKSNCRFCDRAKAQGGNCEFEYEF